MPNPLGIGGQKAGEPGRNPKGRPPGTGFRARLFEKLSQEKEEEIRAGVDWLFQLVREKNFSALKLMLDFFGSKERNSDVKGTEDENETPTISLNPEALKALAAIFSGKKVMVCNDVSNLEHETESVD